MATTMGLWLLMASVVLVSATGYEQDDDLWENHLVKRQIHPCMLNPALCRPQGAYFMRNVLPGINKGSTSHNSGMFYPGKGPTIGGGGGTTWEGATFYPKGSRNVLPGTHKDSYNTNSGMFYPNGPYISGGGAGGSEGATFYPGGSRNVLPGTHKDSYNTNSGMFYPNGPYISGGGAGGSEGATFYPQRSLYDYYYYPEMARSLRSTAETSASAKGEAKVKHTG